MILGHNAAKKHAAHGTANTHANTIELIATEFRVYSPYDDY
jgi:hypothetical protein